MDVHSAQSIHVAHRYGVPAGRVFDAWLDPEIASLWLFATATRPMVHVAIDARVGGSFRLVGQRAGRNVEHAGRYIEIVRPRRLVFSLSLEQRPDIATRVSVDILPRKDGCHLTLTYEGVPREYMSATEGRWTGILYGLEATLHPGSGRQRPNRGRASGASPSSLSPPPE